MVRPWLGIYIVRGHFLVNIPHINAIACVFGNVGEVDEWLSRALRIIPVFHTVLTIPIHTTVDEQKGGDKSKPRDVVKIAEGLSQKLTSRNTPEDSVFHRTSLSLCLFCGPTRNLIIYSTLLVYASLKAQQERVEQG